MKEGAGHLESSAQHRRVAPDRGGKGQRQTPAQISCYTAVLNQRCILQPQTRPQAAGLPAAIRARSQLRFTGTPKLRDRPPPPFYSVRRDGLPPGSQKHQGGSAAVQVPGPSLASPRHPWQKQHLLESHHESDGVKLTTEAL